MFQKVLNSEFHLNSTMTFYHKMHESAGLEFFQLIFEFMCQKYDDKYAFLPTHHFSFEGMQHFKQDCCVLWPGMFLITCEFDMEKNKEGRFLGNLRLLCQTPFIIRKMKMCTMSITFFISFL